MMSSVRVHKKINVAVIGATGSVGTSVLDICREFPELFQVVSLAAARSSQKLLELAEEFHVAAACLQSASSEEAARFRDAGIKLLTGREGLLEIAESDVSDNVVFASSGTDAIAALERALRSDKDVSLANKESIVAAGPWIMPLVKRPDQLRPVDSEHSAIWQCVRSEDKSSVRKIILTASGGPFRELSAEQLKRVTPEAALKHPVWKMGAKITIDSATLMNKGIECIEAMQLFGLPPEDVGVLVHPRSLVHGMAVFSDCTVKMLFSVPDMRLPAAAALAWPKRLDLSVACGGAFDIPRAESWELQFFEPDTQRFPCLALAVSAAKMGTAFPPILVGADNVAVSAFLDGRISFDAIAHVVEETMASFSGSPPKSPQDAIELIGEGERIASRLCGTIGGI